MFYAENSTIKTLDVVSIARGHIEDLSLELSPQHHLPCLSKLIRNTFRALLAFNFFFRNRTGHKRKWSTKYDDSANCFSSDNGIRHTKGPEPFIIHTHDNSTGGKITQTRRGA